LLWSDFGSNTEELDEIAWKVEQFKKSNYQSLGIICKTQEQAEFVYEKIKAPGLHLLGADSTTFKEGVLITTVHIAKGLEFDEVIVPFVSARNYRNEMDRSMLYIACTRAMHQLTVTYTKNKSHFIQ
jgi:DNA helicase-2/ATP-dependent DNA helicase PcrA